MLRSQYLFLFAHVLHMDAHAVDRTRWLDFIYYIDHLDDWAEAVDAQKPAGESG